MLNDEYPLNTADKMAIGNEETPDKTIIGEDTEGIEICISQTDGKGFYANLRYNILLNKNFF